MGGVEMKFCPNCNLQYDDKFGFCKKCGQKLKDYQEQNCKIESKSNFISKKAIIVLGIIISFIVVVVFGFKDSLYDIGIIDPPTTAEKLRYAKQLDEKRKYTDAFKWYMRAAEQGDSQAQFRVGNMYDFGVGVEKNYKEAVKWYRKSAEQGDAQAQCNLAIMYDSGKGVRPDSIEAFKWYWKAAEQGVSQAQFNLGAWYERAQDYDMAFILYKRAAEQGDRQAQYNVGHMYYYGKGVEKNEKEAVKWYKKAAEHGLNYAEKALKDLGY